MPAPPASSMTVAAGQRAWVKVPVERTREVTLDPGDLMGHSGQKQGPGRSLPGPGRGPSPAQYGRSRAHFQSTARRQMPLTGSRTLQSKGREREAETSWRGMPGLASALQVAGPSLAQARRTSTAGTYATPPHTRIPPPAGVHDHPVPVPLPRGVSPRPPDGRLADDLAAACVYAGAPKSSAPGKRTGTSHDPASPGNPGRGAA